MKVAYFSPLNPVESGISDYSEELLEYLAGYGNIELFVDDYRPSAAWLHDNFAVKNYRSFYENDGRNEHDICIYHVGNNDNHAYIWRTLLEYPGLVVLHEPILHHFVFSQTVGNNRLDEYIRELDYSYNSKRPDIIKTTLEARDENSWYNYPLVERIVDSSLGIIVHSDFAGRIVLEANPEAPVKKINSHFAPPANLPVRPQGQLRQALGVGRDDFLIGSFGYMTSNKRICSLLQAVSKGRTAGYKMKLLLVGRLMPGCSAQRLIEELGMEEDVLVTGYIDTLTFWEYLSVPDVCVALRYPSAGETSGSVVKMMGSGNTVLLSDHQAFREFPDDCYVKIPTGQAETDELTRRLVYLLENPEQRRVIGDRARKYIGQHHNIHASARGYAEFMREILSGKFSRPARVPGRLSRKDGNISR